MITQTQQHDQRFTAPTGPKLAKELLGVLQIPRLLLRAPKLATLPRGSQTVVVFPGFGTNDATTLPLRSTVRALGHQPYGWGFGINRAEVEAKLDDVIAMVERRVTESGQPCALIGWSNGGIFAREVARDRPELVTRVITFGTPVFGGPKYTRGASQYSNAEIARLEQVIAERNQIPIQRPITSIYSQADAVVDWRACIDDFSPDVENIEVRSPHAGMLIDPDVFRIIAHRLAAD